MSAAGTPGSVDGTQNELYYLRLHLLLMKAGDVLRTKFDSIITPNNLFYELRNHKREIDKLKKNGILSNDQYNLLNPNPDSKRFDVNLLIVLLRNICNLQPNNPIWKEKDNSKITDTMHPVIANIVRIRNLRNEMQHKHVAYLDQEEFQDNWRLLEHAMVILGNSRGLNNVNAEIKDLVTKNPDIVTPEMKNLRENTIWFLEESCNDEFYVETARFKDANRVLKEKLIIVLTGHPGEGKTAMAARLALADGTKPENCLKLEHAGDWRKVDWSLKLFNTVIVDDIFEGGALNQKLLADWEPYLPEMERAARQKRLRIIITTRHNIKEEAMEELDKPTLFDDKKGYVFLLSSTRYLTFHEKKKILVSRAKKNNSENMITTHRIKYDDCIRKAEGVMNLQKDQKEDFVFGFPQCATLFVRSEVLIKLGPVFFSKPELHLQTYIDQLYKGKDEEQYHKFLALVAVWAEKNMRMTEHDLQNAKNISDHVKYVANCFGIDVTNSFLETLKSSLKSHFNDLLIDRSGEYTFSHNVNGDMVGVVLGSHRLLECIELCPRDFLMERVTIAPARKDELRVVVPKKHYDALCEKFAKIIGKTNRNLVTKEPPHDEFQQLQRKRPRLSTVDALNGIDVSILKHSAFKDEGFVKQFVRYIRENHLDQDLFTVPVMKMTGYFLNYGIKMTEMVMYLPGYTLYSGLIVLAKELIGQEVFPKEKIDPLLLATHFGDIDMMKLLLSHGSKVSGDTLNVAMHKRKGSTFDSNEVLDTIVEYQGIDINDKGNAVNGNYPLIVAARKGFTYEVKCLLQHGADPSVKNDKNLTALHKAVMYKHSNIIQLLIDHDSPLDEKGGTFQRSPLHIAADLGMSKIVKQLLKKGANVKMKDNCGHYPIFLAAIKGHFDTVRILLKHDKSQDSLRIAYSNKTCFIKGMSLMHVAVWRNDRNLIQLLIDGKANPNVKDFFGQTPLLYAIMTGKKTATRLLLQYADKTVPQKQGFTPLHAAIIKGNFKLVAKLAAEVNVNEVDKYGRTPLHVACEKGDINVVNLLLKKHNADPLIITNQEDTVFHILRQTERNKSHEEHCKRRLIEELLLEAHPTIFDRVKGMPNNNGVYITDDPKLASKDLITIKILKQAINCDFDDIIDDDVDDVGSTVSNVTLLHDSLNSFLNGNY